MSEPCDIGLTSPVIPDCLDGASVVSLAKGTRIFQAGDPCNQFFYLLSGSVRVDLVSITGKSIMLYRFGAQETCVLTTSCLISGDQYCAEAHIEEQTTACVLALSAFETRINQSAEFRKLVFGSFSQRLTAMMSKIEDVAFSSIDNRLAIRLLEIHAKTPLITITHEQLATDIGTAREVISRKLARWEDLGLIERQRGTVDILNLARLQEMAKSGQ